MNKTQVLKLEEILLNQMVGKSVLSSSSSFQAVSALRRGDLQQTFPLWQLRLVVELWDSRMLQGPVSSHDTLLTSEFLPVMKNAVDVALDDWLKGEEGQREKSYFRGGLSC